MYDTESVFNVLAADDTERRVASRRALALAHTRVESHLGGFLRQAASAEEFSARFAACQEEFEAYVRTAADEHGYEHPEYIARSLYDHYVREAMTKEAPGKEHMPGVGKKRNRQYEHIKEQLEESGKDEERAKEEAARTVNKTRRKHHELKKDSGAQMMPGQPPMETPGQTMQGLPPQVPPPTTPQQMQQMGQPAQMPQPLPPQDIGQPQSFDPTMGQQPDPTMGQPQGQPFLGSRRWTPFLGGKTAGPYAGELDPTDPAVQHINQQFEGVHPHDYNTEGVWMPNQLQQEDWGFGEPTPGFPADEHMEEIPAGYQGPTMGYPQGELSAPTNMLPPLGGDYGPVRQGAAETMTCPECGGNGKTANQSECPKCKGRGRVPSFGPSTLDKLESSVHIAEDGNTDLDGPEPKMDKRKWTPQTVGDPDPDSKQHPTRRKDPLVPMKAVNDEPLSEIGERTTEREDLPNNTGDAGWDAGGPGPAPHIKTFNGTGQVDPVTQTVLD